MASNSSLKRGTMPAEEQLLLKEIHMKNSISITPSKQNNRYGDKKYVEPVRLTPAWEEKNLPNDVLNFKSVTMEQAELETNPPKDRFLMVYFIIMTFGIGTLMPWNMFINAKSYFEDYKLSPNYTHTDMKFYKTNFIIFLGIASQVPNFLFNWLNIFVNIGGSLTTRIVYSILIEGVIFVCTEALVLADSSSWFDLFFWLTLGSVFILNTANGIYQNSVYGIAARLPSAYMGAVILGSNLSGVFTALINILMKVLSPSDQTRAVYYFIVALLVLLICFDFYFILPQTKFYKFHDLQFIKAQSNTDDYSVLKRTPYWKIFKMCSLQCFNVFFIFFVTLAIYPAVHANVERSGNSDFFVPHDYFSDIMCFVNFNVVAAIGNLLATVWHFPSRKWLHIPILLRAAFIPLFLICNYQIPDRIMPVVIFNEWIYWGIAVLFALTSGWFSSLAMMYCGRSVPAEYSSVAGMFGAACLVTGVCSGILISFVFPVIVKKVQW